MSSGPDALIHDEDEDASDSEDCDIFWSDFFFNFWPWSSLGVLPLLIRTDLGVGVSVGVGLASFGLW